MEAFRAANAVPADYSIGAGDGSRPGRINVNEYDPTHRLLLNVEAIAYHEGIPGHHLQFSIAQEQTDLPAFRRFASYNAYSEGWAFYAERLGKEVGFYQDPYSEYGRLENEMWRSVRLVVDTGVHAQTLVAPADGGLFPPTYRDGRAEYRNRSGPLHCLAGAGLGL